MHKYEKVEEVEKTVIFTVHVSYGKIRNPI